MEATPDTAPDEFEPVKGSKAKRHVRSGELWELDLLHRDHWEVYKNKKKWEVVRGIEPFGAMEDLKRSSKGRLSHVNNS